MSEDPTDPVEPTEPTKQSDGEESGTEGQEVDHEGDNVALRAILSRLAPDADLDAEMDNIAFKRDGTPVYIGDLGKPEPEPEPSTKKRKRVVSRASQRGRGKTTPSLESMSIKQRSKHLDKMLGKE